METKKTPRWLGSFGIRVLIWTAVSIIFAIIGGKTAEYLSAPFYFGFLFTGVLVGMIALFALAAYMAGRRL
jgi:branched-subunit amino acid permease